MSQNLLFEKPDFVKLSKENALVDMHFHTQYSDDCKTKMSDVFKRAKELGVGVAITDHNAISGSLLACKKKGLFAIPGIEVTSKNDKDILLYFYSAGDLKNFYEKNILKKIRKHKKFRFNKTKLSVQEILSIAKDYNAISSLAHPFTIYPKKSFYYFNNKKRSDLINDLVAIEVLNAARKRKGNLASYGWAMSAKKSITGGSDGHRLKWLGNAVTCCKAESVEEFLESIRNKKNFVIGKESTVASKFISGLYIVKNKI
ncbi:MAG: PHP domain-containing protein [Nanoarchaeota archaeon]|nr:PHP domain-containing protein [Nanoarchaeota archaeon]MBU1030440.1 PHP domain-containing protein [Nanoarchaeota archaeon]MBU1849777.1 PHP domain-containing protein [Nanoarchaeota archaeon]